MTASRLLGRPTQDALGKLVLRVTIGGLLLLHGVHKLSHGVGGVKAVLVSNGLPAVFAYGVYVGEVVAPVLLIVGFFTRPAALVLSFNMLVAIALAHRSDVFGLGKGGQWAIEVPVLFLLGGVVIALLGPGRFSASRDKGKFA